MKNVLHYKGYSARPEYSAEDQIFYGKILGIDDLVDYLRSARLSSTLLQVPIKSAYLCLVCEGFLNFHCLSSPNF